MNEQNKTHYRKAFNSPYLSSADIVGNTILTVDKVVLEIDKSKRTKESFNTMYFVEKELRKGEKLKPMILNATNSKTMYELTRCHHIEDWKGTRITIYIDPNVRFGRDTVEGLRISPKSPAQLIYNREKFDENFPKWQELVKSGKKKAESIITMMQNGFNLSESQINELNKLKEIENAK